MRNATSAVLEFLLYGIVLICCGAVAGGLYLGLVAQANADPCNSSAFAFLLFAGFNGLLAFGITTSLLLMAMHRLWRASHTQMAWVGALFGGGAAALAAFTVSVSSDLVALEQLPSLLAGAGLLGLVGLALMVRGARPSLRLDSPSSRPTLIRGA